MAYIFAFIIKILLFQTKRLSYLCLFITSFLLSCSHADDIDREVKKSINDSIYAINNKLAKERMAKIESQYNTEGCFKLVHISDPHLSAYSQNSHYEYPINLIQSVRFANQTDLNINAMVATGDFISNHPEKKSALSFLQSFIYHYFNGNKIPSFICTGNHDSNIINNSFKAYIEPEEINQKFNLSYNYDKLRSQQIKENYYYIDMPNPQGGYIRLISLDMLDQPTHTYNTTIYASYSQKQINWLCDVALTQNLTKQHSVIILNHYPFQAYSKTASTYLCDGDFVHGWNMIPEIVEAYRSKTTLHKTYKNKFEEKDSICVNSNFSKSPGEFICYLGGHIHSFANFKITGLSNASDKLPQQMIICTNQTPTEIGTIYNKVEREDDTISSNSFNIYYIDTIHKKIYITYFGAYIPKNDPLFPEIITVSYI